MAAACIHLGVFCLQFISPCLYIAGRGARSMHSRPNAAGRGGRHVLNCCAAIVLQENLEDLFYQYGVNVIFTGHVHAYER